MNDEDSGITGAESVADPEEAGWIARILEGEARLYSRLVDRYQRRLWFAMTRMVGDSDEAADVVQEAFVKAWEKLDGYDPRYRFYTWLYTIARNRALNSIRRRKLRGFLSLSRQEAGPLVAPDDASDRARRGEIALALEACRATLPGDQREVFDLRHADGMAYSEIAKAIGAPEGTVMSRLHRAREKMRECLRSKGVTWGAGEGSG
ncbi:MAG: sigma-70 family RNA polymerase sigma factor [Gemmatimonadetes bacterium]|nr:sigma-70 family RNA polymerase sigma factor [Gemmatimonadota bacterium]